MIRRPPRSTRTDHTLSLHDALPICSFLNHQYLVAARPPYYPNADKGPAKERITVLDEGDPHGVRPRQTAQSPASAMDGPVRFVPNSLTPDFYAVNTMLPPYAPSYDLDRSEEHTSELRSLMRISYAVFCLKKKKKTTKPQR